MKAFALASERTRVFPLSIPLLSGRWTLSLGATYAIKDNWSLNLSVQRDCAYELADNIEAHVGLGWSF